MNLCLSLGEIQPIHGPLTGNPEVTEWIVSGVSLAAAVIKAEARRIAASRGKGVPHQHCRSDRDPSGCAMHKCCSCWSVERGYVDVRDLSASP